MRENVEMLTVFNYISSTSFWSARLYDSLSYTYNMPTLELLAFLDTLPFTQHYLSKIENIKKICSPAYPWHKLRVHIAYYNDTVNLTTGANVVSNLINKFRSLLWENHFLCC